MRQILIIGAGISATALATELSTKLSTEYSNIGDKRASNSAVKITVIEKSRGFGGRMATRRQTPFEFDHGAQFFTARSDAFQHFVRTALEKGWLSEWHPRLCVFENGRRSHGQDWRDPHYVAVPRMSSLCRETLMALEARGVIELRLETEVTRIHRQEDYRWRAMSGTEPIGDFDFVISTAPSRQTEILFGDWPFSGILPLRTASQLPCFSLMVGLNKTPLLDFDLARVKDSPISLIVSNNSKPRRKNDASLLIHSDNHWAQIHFDDCIESVKTTLLDEFLRLTDIDKQSIEHIDLHRWRYAKTDLSAGKNFLMDADSRLAACGDWCLGGRIEEGFLSGASLGRALTSHFMESFAG